MLRIKQLIKEHGFTQAEFAEKLNITRVGLSQLINGKPSYSTLEKMAAALNVPIWQLFISREEAAGRQLNALIECNGNFFKASTIEELENIIAQIKGCI